MITSEKAFSIAVKSIFKKYNLDRYDKQILSAANSGEMSVEIRLLENMSYTAVDEIAYAYSQIGYRVTFEWNPPKILLYFENKKITIN